jgi:hypothetical protein
MKKRNTTNKDIPTVGMGACINCGSDRSPATVIQVTNVGKRIVLQEDKAIRVDSNGVSDSQIYDFEIDEEGTIHVATLRKDGRYRISGGRQLVTLGKRDKYYDYSF